ncbi:unnamed protein product [Effrenium voratum]|nr:unnamed protein product [Effrenium voratum]
MHGLTLARALGPCAMAAMVQAQQAMEHVPGGPPEPVPWRAQLPSALLPGNEQAWPDVRSPPSVPLATSAPSALLQATTLPGAVAPAMAVPSEQLCEDFYNFHSEVITKSPFLNYAKHFGQWLRSSSYQVSIALGALLCGAVCAWDGPKLWEALVITTLALGAAWVLHFEAEQRGLASGLSEVLLVLGAAGTTALAVHSGFEGSQAG